MKDRIIKSIPDSEEYNNHHKIAEPCQRIDMKNVPYKVYVEFVEECNKEDLHFRQLFVKMWKVYIKSKKKHI